MTSTFGSLLPPAAYLTTPYGRAAYYVLPPQAEAPAPEATPSSAPMRILMVHGLQTPALGLVPLAAALCSRFPHASIALFDHWGHGLSDTPIRPHTPPLFYELIDLVLARVGWSACKVHLVGYSFGSVTVAGYAASGRDVQKKIASVVHIAPAGLIDSSSFPEEVRTRYLPVRGDGGSDADERGARDWILEFLEGGNLVVPTDWEAKVARGGVVAEAIRDWEMRVHKGHLGSVVAIFRDAAVLDNQVAFARSAETGVKTLAVLGELDDLSSAQDLQSVGISNVVVVPQAGHAVVRQNVPEVAQHIENFYNSLEQAL